MKPMMAETFIWGLVHQVYITCQEVPAEDCAYAVLGCVARLQRVFAAT
jgi:hypothetical protein